VIADDSYQNKSVTLHDAHRAGLQADHLLQVQAKSQQGYRCQSERCKYAARRRIEPVQKHRNPSS
jgi:hypothetical protein